MDGWMDGLKACSSYAVAHPLILCLCPYFIISPPLSSFKESLCLLRWQHALEKEVPKDCVCRDSDDNGGETGGHRHSNGGNRTDDGGGNRKHRSRSGGRRRGRASSSAGSIGRASSKRDRGLRQERRRGRRLLLEARERHHVPPHDASLLPQTTLAKISALTASDAVLYVNALSLLLRRLRLLEGKAGVRVLCARRLRELREEVAYLPGAVAAVAEITSDISQAANLRHASHFSSLRSS
jgi:hypothetical protein